MIPWTADTRRGSFESFYAAYGSLARAEFLAAVKSPVLMTAVSTDSATWQGTLVLKVEKRSSGAKIAITANVDSGGDLEAAAGRIYVGRTPESDVTISAPTVSKRHAYFAAKDGGWEIADAGSANGTIVEGQRLKPNKRERLRRSLSTIEFGPDARFVFMLPDSVFDLFDEIHRSRGVRASSKLKLPTGPVVDAADEHFESLAKLPIEEEASTSAVRSVHPSKEAEAPPPSKPPAKPEPVEKATVPDAKPRHRATWQGKRPDLDGDTDSLGKSTDKITVKVAKTPEEQEEMEFEYALKAVSSLGSLVHKLEAILKVGDQTTLLLGEGSKNTIEECRDALVKMRPLLRAIRMEMVVGDRKPVEIFRAKG